MNNRLKILNVLDIISYIAIINATMFVLLFEFTSTGETLYVALASFIVAFLSQAIFGVLRLVYSKSQHADANFVLSTKQKIWIVVKIVLSGALLAFACIIYALW